MATGVYNRVNLSAANDTVIVSNTAVDVGKTAVITVSIVNRNTSNITIRLGISANTTLSESDFLEFNTPLNQSGVLERTGIILTRGLNLIANSSVGNTSVIAYGIEG